VKYLKKFNESKNTHDYEITDYFLDLEDRGILEIYKIREPLQMPAANEWEDGFHIAVSYINHIINNAIGTQKSNPRYIIETPLKKYLDYFSIQNAEEFFKFMNSDEYIPLMSLNLKYKAIEHLAIDEIKKSLTSCVGLRKTQIFGFQSTVTKEGVIYFTEEK
jgi:hypothetical protein